jgi:transposase
LEKKSSQSKFVTKTWEELVFRVEKELKNLYDEVDTLLGKNKSLKEACENLQTILGIGKTTAVILLAEIPDINAFKNARQLTAYAGLTPSQRFSG